MVFSIIGITKHHFCWQNNVYSLPNIQYPMVFNHHWYQPKCHGKTMVKPIVFWQKIHHFFTQGTMSEAMECVSDRAKKAGVVCSTRKERV